MSVRETFRERPYICIEILAGLILITIVTAWSTVYPGVREPSLPSKMYFSDDDGKTFFADDSSNIAPFDHGGKRAVQAAVFECKGNKFVGYLIRYDNPTKASLEAMSMGDRQGTKAIDMRQLGEMVKKPGDKDWLPLKGDRPVAQIVSPPCPDGSDQTPKLISP